MTLSLTPTMRTASPPRHRCSQLPLPGPLRQGRGRERGGEGEGEGRDASKKAEAPVSKAVVEEGGGERRRRSDGAAREDGAGGGEAVAAGDIEAQNAAATKIQSRARGMQASMPHTQSPLNTSSFS